MSSTAERRLVEEAAGPSNKETVTDCRPLVQISTHPSIHPSFSLETQQSSELDKAQDTENPEQGSVVVGRRRRASSTMACGWAGQGHESCYRSSMEAFLLPTHAAVQDAGRCGGRTRIRSPPKAARAAKTSEGYFRQAILTCVSGSI